MIGYYLHHQGHGHRRRGTAVARSLQTPVVGLGSGGAPEGWPGDWVELARDDEPVVTDPETEDVTARGVLHWVPRAHPGLLERHSGLVSWLAEARPSLVVVDVSVEVALLVRLCGIPVVVGAMPGDRTDSAHRLAYDLADALLAPWPPGAHPDAGWPDHWRDKTWEVGGISALSLPHRAHGVQAETPHRAHGVQAATPHRAHGVQTPGASSVRAGRPAGRALVVWGSGGGTLDGTALDAAAAATPGWEWLVRGGGHPPSPDLLADLLAADVVVCHAGQGAVADVALARRPAVVLAQPRPHEEQVATARALERMSLAATSQGWPPATDWPHLIERALDIGGDGWENWGADGAARAAARLDDLADRFEARASGPTALVVQGAS